jgi:hypothetical protein
MTSPTISGAAAQLALVQSQERLAHAMQRVLDPPMSIDINGVARLHHGAGSGALPAVHRDFLSFLGMSVLVDT